MKKILCEIGKDYFGVQRIYIPLSDMSQSVTDNFQTNLVCADCGKQANYFVVNLNFKEKDEHNQFMSTGYLYCGECAVG